MYEAVSGDGLLPRWHQAISPILEPMLTYWFCCCYGPALCISWIVQQINMFKFNLEYPISWLISLLGCITFELNWIGIERKWIELELNWKILNPIWIGIEKYWIQLELELNWIERNELIRALLVTRPTCCLFKQFNRHERPMLSVPRDLCWPSGQLG